MIKTHVILDGLQDATAAKRLSQNWTNAGFANTVDMAGQCGTLWPEDSRESLTEEDIDRAASLARVFGIEIRDRAGNTFVADNDLQLLRRQMRTEYQRRIAIALMFGLPAILLHYLGQTLAGADTPRQMVLPWLIEGVLAIWVAIAAGWAILWQGLFSIRGLRATGDLMTTIIVSTAIIPTSIALLAMPFVDQPWLMMDDNSTLPGVKPCFDVAVWAVLLAVLQRRIAYGCIDKLSGYGDLMVQRFGMIISAWLIVMSLAAIYGGLRVGLAVGLLMQPLASLAGINRWSPGMSILLPTFGFVVVFMLGVSGFGGISLRGVEVEVAVGFSLIMIAAMGWGWKRFAA